MRLTGEGLSAVRGGRLVFADVGFSVGAGELLAVTGRNGAGKSTLLRLIAGLLPPAAGGVALKPAEAGDLQGNVHYIGHLDGLKIGLTVRQNLVFWRRLWNGGDADAALAAMRLEALADLPAAVLAAGQRRRVALARLLVAPRPVWLLDEPATALDALAEEGLGGLIAAHLAGGGLAIAATHRDLPFRPSQTLRLGAA
ncbi:heme ABC exporter ATP-binding protein CcmA [soil metagenome]